MRIALLLLLAGAIPWLPQRPVTVDAHPPRAPACRAGALHAHLNLQGATGNLIGGIDLLNAGARPCSLVGAPRISFAGTTAQWRLQRIAVQQPVDVLADPPGSLRALAPGRSASIELFWSNWCGTAPSGFAVRLGGGTTLLVPTVRTPRCDAPTSPSVLSVAPFTPTERRLPASSRLPLAVAAVGPKPVRVKPGVRAFRVRGGTLFRYEVAVTNTGPTPFRFAGSSCPVYIEQLNAAAARPYVLNCRPAGTIAPHATVRFEMQIPIPADARLGAGIVTWELAPRTYDAPFATADVWVTR